MYLCIRYLRLLFTDFKDYFSLNNVKLKGGPIFFFQGKYNNSNILWSRFDESLSN